MFIMKILYGQNDIWLECTNKFAINEYYMLPAYDDNRCVVVGLDPCPGIYKDIVIVKNDNTKETLSKNESYRIILTDSEVIISIWSIKNTINKYLGNNTYTKLEKLKSCIKYQPDAFNDELPEQAMIYSFLYPDAKVLEIGGNTGRSTAIIGKILENGKGEAYVLETLKDPYNINKNMCEKNGFKCTLINAALSEHNIVQCNWLTAIEDSPGTKKWDKIPTITYENLKLKMGYDPTTLVLDCEGAFTDILKSYPELMKSVDTVIIENDFRDKKNAEYVHNIFHQNGLTKVVSIPLYDVVIDFTLPSLPCSEYFFEVYKRE